MFPSLQKAPSGVGRLFCDSWTMYGKDFSLFFLERAKRFRNKMGSLGKRDVRSVKRYRSKPEAAGRRVRMRQYVASPPRLIPMVRGENKWFDTTLNGTAMAAAGTLTPTSGSLNLFTVGTGESQMIGRRCRITAINVRGAINMVDSSTGGGIITSQFFRLALVLDKQCNGAVAAVTDIYETANLRSFKNLNNSGRFLILKEWYDKIDVSAAGGTPTDLFHVGSAYPLRYTKVCNIPLEFNTEATPGTRVITEVRTNNVFMVAFSEDGNLLVSAIVRLRFSDS